MGKLRMFKQDAQIFLAAMEGGRGGVGKQGAGKEGQERSSGVAEQWNSGIVE
jgi:hypothetical protein